MLLILLLQVKQMDSFKYKNKEVVFWSVTGEVIGQNKYSETHISSSGGGGQVINGSGFVKAPEINTETIENHEFWIRKPNGTEKSIKLVDANIPLRIGQKITLISAGLKDKDTGYHVVLVNHNANSHWFVNNLVNITERKLKLSKRASVLPIFIAPFVWFFLSYVWGDVVAAIFCGGSAYAWIKTKKSRFDDAYSKLKSHLEMLAQNAYTEK